jgi:hypothetical protein
MKEINLLRLHLWFDVRVNVCVSLVQYQTEIQINYTHFDEGNVFYFFSESYLRYVIF